MSDWLFLRFVYLIKTEHLAGGLIWRQIFSPFTRPRRTTCLFLCVCGSLAGNALLLAGDGVPLDSRILTGLLSSLLLLPSVALFSLIFRRIDTMATSRMRVRKRVRKVQESVAFKVAVDFAMKAVWKQRSESSEPPPQPPGSGKTGYVRKSSAHHSHSPSSICAAKTPPMSSPPILPFTGPIPDVIKPPLPTSLHSTGKGLRSHRAQDLKGRCDGERGMDVRCSPSLPRGQTHLTERFELADGRSASEVSAKKDNMKGFFPVRMVAAMTAQVRPPPLVPVPKDAGRKESLRREETWRKGKRKMPSSSR